MNEQRTYTPSEIKEFYDCYQELRRAILDFHLEYNLVNLNQSAIRAQCSRKPNIDLGLAIRKYEECSCKNLRDEFIRDEELQVMRKEIQEVRDKFASDSRLKNTQ